MKFKITLGLQLAVFMATAQSIQLKHTDLPLVNDTIRVSNATANATNAGNYQAAGDTVIWDYSALTATSQEVRKFEPAASTPYIGLNNLYISDYGVKNNASYLTNALPAGLPITIGNIYDFYNLTAPTAFNSIGKYVQSGIGVTLNGIGLPAMYNPQDRIYKLPTTYNTMDSSDAKVNFSIPNTLSWKERIHRVNHADAYGTLITPLGTFNTIRIKTRLDINDSITPTVGGFTQTFGINRTNFEYKWFATGSRLPVLQINTSKTGANENVTAIIFKDSLRSSAVQIGMQEQNKMLKGKLFPNPCKDKIYFTSESKLSITKMNLIDLQGKMINLNFTTADQLNYVAEIPQNLAGGTYFIMINSTDNLLLDKVEVVR